jgi:hypothetical protein
VTTVLRRLLRGQRTELDLIGTELWAAGVDMKGQLWGELAVRIATRQPFALCARCGEPFAFRRASGLYCGNTCRVMASRERRAPEPTPQERARRLLARIDQELHDAAYERLPSPAFLSENRAILEAIAGGETEHVTKLAKLEQAAAEEFNLLDLRRDARDLVARPERPQQPSRGERSTAVAGSPTGRRPA